MLSRKFSSLYKTRPSKVIITFILAILKCNSTKNASQSLEISDRDFFTSFWGDTTQFTVCWSVFFQMSKMYVVGGLRGDQ